MPVAKEQIRQIIGDNNLNSVADIYSLLKDILQELMEAELDSSLGYEKNQKENVRTSNKRNGHSPKTVKSQYGEFQINVPRDRDGGFEPKLIPKYQRDVSGIEQTLPHLPGKAVWSYEGGWYGWGTAYPDDCCGSLYLRYLWPYSWQRYRNCFKPLFICEIGYTVFGNQWSLPIVLIAIIVVFDIGSAAVAVYAPAKRIRNMPITATINEL